MPVSITSHVIERLDPERANAAAQLGAEFGQQKQCRDPRLQDAWAVAADVQIAIGMTGLTRRLLTAPASNTKLAKAQRPSWGLTLFHHLLRTTTVVDRKRLIVNACPFAGDCTRLCVLNNGNGRFDSVRQGWRWKTELLVRDPEAFMLLLSFSIARVVRSGNPILFRPNVNSDIEWEMLCPDLFDGSIFDDLVTFYGYTKVPFKKLDGWLTPAYRVAFSANENHPIDGELCRSILDAGGNIAVVTDRAYGANPNSRAPIRQWHADHPVVDGDTSDEWILDHDGVIGDLAFKPDTSELADFGRTSAFVHPCYSEELV